MNGYGLHSKRTEPTNACRQTMTNNEDVYPLKTKDYHQNSEPTSRFEEEYNTPLDFSSKRSTMITDNISNQCPFIAKDDNNALDFKILSKKQMFDSSGIEHYSKYPNDSRSLMNEEKKSTNDMIFLDMRRLENTINPFSIDRLISKQEGTMESNNW